jgi:phage/plasmid-associated DNA primase
MLLEKYKIYKKQGLVEPKQVIEATGRYHESTDTIQHFIDDNLEKSEDRTHDVYVTFKEIYERYRHSEYFDKTLKQKDIKEMLINKLDHFEKEARVTDRVTKQSCIKKSVFLYHQLTSEIIEQPQKTPIVYELKDN